MNEAPPTCGPADTAVGTKPSSVTVTPECEAFPTGLLFLGAQQVLAFACSLVMHVTLGRALGPETYGVFWVVSATLSLLTLVFQSGLPLAVSKFTAEDESRAASLRRRALGIQATVGVAVAVALFRGAPLLSAHLGNPDLTPLLQSAALALPLTGLATVFVQHLNGLRAFGRQATALATQSLAKTLAVTLPLLLGFGIAGSVWGLVVAAGVFFAVAAALSRRTVADRSFPTRKLARLGFLLSVNFTFVALWGQLDLLMLEALGNGSDAVGLFTAATTLSGAAAVFSYPLLTALFPRFSRAAASAAPEVAVRALEKSLYYTFALLCPCVVGAHFLGRELLAVFYGARFTAAAFAVGPLVLGVLFFALYEIIDTYMRSSGHAARSLQLTATLVAVHFAANWILIPRYQLLGVVISVVAVCLLAMLAAGLFAVRTLRLGLPWRQCGRVLLLSGLAFAPLYFWKPHGTVTALLAAGACVTVYLGFVVQLQLVDAEDRSRLSAALRALAARIRRGSSVRVAPAEQP